MQIHVGEWDPDDVELATFNSLFEMQIAVENLLELVKMFLSILYLRCGSRAACGAVAGGDAFNSLFEMPGPCSIGAGPSRRAFQFSI